MELKTCQWWTCCFHIHEIFARLQMTGFVMDDACFLDWYQYFRPSAIPPHSRLKFSYIKICVHRDEHCKLPSRNHWTRASTDWADCVKWFVDYQATANPDVFNDILAWFVIVLLIVEGSRCLSGKSKKHIGLIVVQHTTRLCIWTCIRTKSLTKFTLKTPISSRGNHGGQTTAFTWRPKFCLTPQCATSTLVSPRFNFQSRFNFWQHFDCLGPSTVLQDWLTL